MLAEAAVSSKVDPLYGLKENVIIGKLIPAGTGFVEGRFDQAMDEVTPGKPDIEVQQLNIFPETEEDDFVEEEDEHLYDDVDLEGLDELEASLSSEDDEELDEDEEFSDEEEDDFEIDLDDDED